MAFSSNNLIFRKFDREIDKMTKEKKWMRHIKINNFLYFFININFYYNIFLVLSLNLVVLYVFLVSRKKMFF